MDEDFSQMPVKQEAYIGKNTSDESFLGNFSYGEEDDLPSENHQKENLGRWTSEEIHAMIDLWEQFYEDLNQTKRNSTIYQKMSVLLQKKIQRKFPFSGMDVYSKVETMKKQYMRNKKKLKMNGTSSWSYFERIDTFLNPPQSPAETLKRKRTIIKENDKKRIKCSNLNLASSSLANVNDGVDHEDDSPQFVRWPRRDVFVLIRLWEQLIQDQPKVCLTKAIYKRLAIHLQHEIQKEPSYSERDIYNKIDSLKRQYKKCGNRLNLTQWPYFRAINRILRRFPPEGASLVGPQAPRHLKQPENKSSTSHSSLAKRSNTLKGRRIAGPGTERWSHEEVIALMDLWQEFSEHLRRTKRDSDIYKLIALRLQQKLQREVPYSGIDIFNKFQTMRRQYRKNKKKCRMGRCSSVWRYYDRMTSLLETPHSDGFDEGNSFAESGLNSNHGLTLEEYLNSFHEEGASPPRHDLPLNEQGKAGGEEWTDDEVEALLQLWEEFTTELMQGGNPHLYGVIAWRLQLKLQRATPFSEVAVHSKLWTLTGQYEEQRRKFDFEHQLPKWQFFHRIGAILESGDVGPSEQLDTGLQSEFNSSLSIPSEDCPVSFNEDEDNCSQDPGDSDTKRWTYREVDALIDLWEEFYQDLARTKRNSHIFRQIAARLQQKLNRFVSYTENDVHNKVDALKRQYKKNIRRCLAQGTASHWRYFNRIDRLLGSRDPTDTASGVTKSDINSRLDDSFSSVDDESIHDYDLKRWTSEEVTALIDLWEEFYDDLGQKWNFRVYKRIALRLQEQLKKDVPYSELDVHRKLQVMKKQYHTNVRRYQQDGKPSQWQYFDKVHCFLGNCEDEVLKHEEDSTKPETNVFNLDEYSSSFNEDGDHFSPDRDDCGSKRWTDEEVYALIELWEGFLEDLKKPKRNSHLIYSKIASRLHERLGRDTPYTEMDIHNKIEVLKRQYRKNIRDHWILGRSPQWRYFDRIDSLLKDSESDLLQCQTTVIEPDINSLLSLTLEEYSSFIHKDEETEAEIQETKRTDSRRWPYEDVNALLDLWEEFLEDLRKPKRNSHYIYSQMALRLQEQLQRVFPYTEMDIRNKIEVLKRQYRKNVYRYDVQGRPSQWCYFERIEGFLRSSPDGTDHQQSPIKLEMNPSTMNSELSVVCNGNGNSLNEEYDKKMKRWTFEEVNVLLDLWEEFYEDLKQRRNFPIYKQISRKLQQELQRQVPYSELDVQNKLHLLKREYQRNQKRMMSNGKASQWQYFDKISKFFVNSQEEFSQSSINVPTSENESSDKDGQDSDQEPRRRKWTSHEMNILIDLWEKSTDLQEERNSHILDSIAVQLKDKLESKSPFSNIDVLRQVNSLERRYRRELKRCVVQGVPSHWQYFDRLDKFLTADDEGRENSPLQMQGEMTSGSGEGSNFLNEGEASPRPGDSRGWLNEEITVLIGLWEEFSEELRKDSGNCQVHSLIATQLQQQLKNEVPFTEVDVRRKFEEMRKEYKKHKKKCRIEGISSSWHYFDRMHKLLAYPREVLLKHQTTVIKCKRRSYVDLLLEKSASSSCTDGHELPNEKPNNLTVKWSSQEISALIGLWEHSLEDLTDAKENDPIYGEIAVKLQQQIQREDPFTSKDIHAKLEQMKRRYRKCGRRSPCSHWKYFPIINRFLRWFPGKDPSQELIQTTLDESDRAHSFHPAKENCVSLKGSKDLCATKQLENPDSKVWKKEEIFVLIKLWEDQIEELTTARRTAPIYKKIAEDLQLHLQRNVAFTMMDVHNKIKTMKKQYRRCGRRRVPPQWCYYASLNRFLAASPIRNKLPQNDGTKTSQKCFDPKPETFHPFDLNSPNPDSRTWRKEEVESLIELWEEFYEDLSRGKRTAPIYSQVAALLQQRHPKKLPYTEKEIHNKIETLKMQYVKCGRTRPFSEWHYFPIINNFIRWFSVVSESPPRPTTAFREAQKRSLKFDLKKYSDSFNHIGDDSKTEIDYPKSKKWIHEEVCALICLWEEFAEELKKSKRHALIFEQIAARLQMLFPREYPFTYIDVQTKVDTLKRQYKKTGNAPSTSQWPYFKMINQFLKNFPTDDDPLAYQTDPYTESSTVDLEDNSCEEDDKLSFPDYHTLL